jgi:hypothetical protein
MSHSFCQSPLLYLEDCAASPLHARASPTALWAPMSLPLISSDVLVGKAEMRRSNQGSRRIDSTCCQLTKAWSYIGQILTGWMFDALLSLYGTYDFPVAQHFISTRHVATVTPK